MECSVGKEAFLGRFSARTGERPDARTRTAQPHRNGNRRTPRVYSAKRRRQGQCVLQGCAGRRRRTTPCQRFGAHAKCIEPALSGVTIRPVRALLLDTPLKQRRAGLDPASTGQDLSEVEHALDLHGRGVQSIADSKRVPNFSARRGAIATDRLT